MNHRSVIGALALAAVALFPAAVPAWQQSDPLQEKSGPMGRGTMGGGMMMGQMMAHHQEMSQLMSKMMQSMAAIKTEKDPAKLKDLLAEHAALLEQMRTGMMGQGNMMQNMAGLMKNCPGMGDAGKPASK